MLNIAACNQRWRDKKYSLRSALQVGLPRDCCILFILFVMVLVDSPFVCGNAGPVESTGSLVGEPRVVTAVTIVREDLELDLRALSKSDTAQVSATYYLENPGDPEKIKLAFAFGSERHQDCKISLDGKQIETIEANSSFEVSKHWFPPETTPLLRGLNDPLRYGAWRSVAPTFFEAEIPSGESILQVRYNESVKVVFDRPAMYRQMAYILSPAKSWAGFGNLKIRVALPDDWEVATNLDMQREGDLLSGDYRGIPADALAITLRPPVSPIYHWVVEQRVYLVSLISLVVIFFGLYRLGKVFSDKQASEAGVKKNPSLSQMMPPLLLYCIIASFAIGSAFCLVSFGLDLMFPMSDLETLLSAKLRISDGYARALMLVASVLVCVLFFFLSVIQCILQYLWLCRIARNKPLEKSSQHAV